MAPQLNEKKMDHPVANRSCHCLKQASVFCCCTVRTSRWSWINEKSNKLSSAINEGDVRSKQSVQPHMTTSVQTPFCF